MKYLNYIALLLFTIAFTNCKSNRESASESVSKTTTPVTITTVRISSIGEEISMNAVSVFQQKNTVRSNVNGYIGKLFVKIGDYVQAGKTLYTLQTKESEALSNYNKNDSTFHIKNNMTIKAPSSGIITEITKAANEYVADGDQLCVIADQKSFVFLLSVPFEQNRYVTIGSHCNLLLPDSSIIPGTIIAKLASVDAVSQTQDYVIKIHTNRSLPENLVATVKITRNTKQQTQVVDKNCVLSDETVENFWVMKLINDSTAVKVPIKKGITTDTHIEILSPRFSKDDRFVNSGNYGLPDTAYVNIIDN